MRVNKYIAAATGMSRRAADKAIEEGRVTLNGHTAVQGQDVSEADTVLLDNRTIAAAMKTVTIMLNKPAGYVVSRNGQGSKTIYDLLPLRYHRLKPIGRLDKDSSGLLLLTNDGQLAQELTHPKYEKTKVYEVELDRPLTADAQDQLQSGVQLDDGPSHLDVHRLILSGTARPSNKTYRVHMHEGRNRQIRRTFATLGYKVTRLHRTHFGDYVLEGTAPGATQLCP